MNSGILSMRYAKALLQYAELNQEAQQVYVEMNCLAQAYFQVPNLSKTLLNPVLSHARKQQLLIAALGQAEEPTLTIKRFITLLLQKQRISVMLLIAHAYADLYRQSRGLMRAQLTVATDPSPAVISRLRAMVEQRTHQEVDFQVVTDSTIGGGFILEYGTYRLDASVRRSLTRIRQQLSV